MNKTEALFSFGYLVGQSMKAMDLRIGSDEHRAFLCRVDDLRTYLLDSNEPSEYEGVRQLIEDQAEEINTLKKVNADLEDLVRDLKNEIEVQKLARVDDLAHKRVNLSTMWHKPKDQDSSDV